MLTDYLPAISCRILVKGTLWQLLMAFLLGGLTYAYDGKAQEVLNRKVSLSLQNQTIETILDQVATAADVRFVYSPELIRAERRISIRVANEPLERVLQTVLNPLQIRYEVSGRRIVLKRNRGQATGGNRVGENDPATTAPADQPVTGKVTEAGSGAALPGVSVLIKGSGTSDRTRGTTTDADGNFRIDVPGPESVLVFSYVGFQSQEVTVGGRSALTVSLQPSQANLDEVVVIGYGERQRKDLTGAISVVGGDDLVKNKAINPELSMQGRLPGVFVSTPGGAPNARPTVRIRGQNTLGNNEPLYVVDGVPITEFGNGATQITQAGDIRGTINVLSLINPNDIESISVLKDASSAAIYGVRAANGVILITTKRGKSGRPRVEVAASRGVQNLPKTYDVLSVQEYVELVREAYANNPAQAANLPAVYKADNAAYFGNSPFVDWQRAIINRNAVIEDYSAKLSGGSEATTYYVSGGYSRTESPLVQNYLKRYSLATNVTSKIGRLVEVGLTNRLAYVDALDNTQADLNSAWRYAPWQPIYATQGGLAPVVNPTFAPNPNFNPQLVSPGSPFNITNTGLLYGTATRSNILGLYDTRQTDYNILRTLGSAYVQLEPLKGLKFRGTLSADWYLTNRNVWQNINAYRYISPFSNTFAGTNGSSKGLFNERLSRNFNLVKEFSINFDRTFGGHNVNVLLNAMDQYYGYGFSASNNSQIPFDNPEARTLLNTAPFSTGQVIKENNALQGYLARVSYNYKSKYYVDATVRRDGTSRFAEEYRWGTFPSLALAWRISAEPFMNDLSWLNDLKIRAGIGELGNQETRLFAFLSQVNFSPDYAYGSGVNGDAFGSVTNGVRLPDLPTPTLSWERVRTKNIGVDAALLEGRLTTTIEYYDKTTSGILQSVVLPGSTGVDEGFAPVNNVASVRNSGFEFELGYNGRVGNDLTYTVSGNLTTVRNRVVGLYRDLAFGSNNRTEIGRPINYLYGYKFGGIYQNQAEIDTRKTTVKDAINADRVVPGDAYFEDTNGDGTVNANDRVFLGSVIPGHYYGVNLGANYKGFDLSIFFQGVGDIQAVNGERQAGIGMNSENINQFTEVRNRWTPTNPSSTLPRAVIGDPAQNNRFSDRWVENAGFMRLKNLQVGYSLPASWLTRTGAISGVRLYVTGNNLLTFTQFSGLDPENSAIPPARSWILGLNLNF